MAHRMGFFEALDWLIQNDDCDLTNVEYLSDPENTLSVTASFVADCYGKSDTDLRNALVRRLKKNAKE